MKKFTAEKNIIAMYEFLSNYCQLSDDDVYKYLNMPHERIQELLPDVSNTRFPIRYYIEDYVRLGIIVLVRDRSGKTLPYINPL